jgi:phosphosulfolactate phosphohydrolase-like enzyme
LALKAIVASRCRRCQPADLRSLGAALPIHTAVVMDVLRMSSTAAVLMRRPGCEAIAVAATPEDLEELAQPVETRLVVSELQPVEGGGAWIDNSPAKVAHVDLAGRMPVLVTTNGTRTLLAAAACASRVLLASFRDLHAVARHLAGASVVLVPAGHFPTGERRLEDDLCADALQALLEGRTPDLEAAASAVREDPRVQRRLAGDPGFAADLELSLQVDPAAVALAFVATGTGVGRITRAL